MKKLLFCALWTLMLLSLPGSGQTIETIGSTDKSVDYVWLARIDTVVNEYIGKGWLNGAVSIVAKDNWDLR